MIQFDWDEAKALSNLRKHGVSFIEARSVFYDDWAIQFFNEAHSAGEDRFILLGVSSKSRLLVVVHCENATADTIRIISARKATKNERQYYRGPSS